MRHRVTLAFVFGTSMSGSAQTTHGHLGHCRKAIRPEGRLLIVEMVLPPGDTPHPGKIHDMVMLMFPGGQERTESEYASLLNASRFRLNRIVPTASAVSIVEAIPAGAGRVADPIGSMTSSV